MSIKPDAWIKRMAESEGMIEPFSENQVRVDEKGKKLSKRNQSMSLRAQLDNKVSSQILLGKALSKNQAITLSDAIRFISEQINLFA